MPLRNCPDESRDLPISIVWDVDNVGIPREIAPGRIPWLMQEKLARLGYTGLISIEIIGGAEDRFRRPERLVQIQEAAALNHIPVSIEWAFPLGSVYTAQELLDAADKIIVESLSAFPAIHDPHESIFLLAGDHYYCKACKDLFEGKMNVALIYVPGNTSADLLQVFKDNTPENARDNTLAILPFLGKRQLGA